MNKLGPSLSERPHTSRGDRIRTFDPSAATAECATGLRYR